MNTPKYPITEADFPLARDDLQRKLTRQPWWWVDHEQAEKEWFTAKNDRHRLQHWCERWLDEGQWRLLQKAVHSAHQRRRAARRCDPKCVTVTLSGTAWRIVSTLAEQEGLSPSDWLIQRHQLEWRYR
jgi:hypothetical protein